MMHRFLQRLHAGQHRVIVGEESLNIVQNQIGLHIAGVGQVGAGDIQGLGEVIHIHERHQEAEQVAERTTRVQDTAPPARQQWASQR